MFANLAGTGAQPFCRYVSSASRADITGDGKVSSLAPDPSTPQVPPARERVACKKERKSANKRISENKENLENRNAHDDMRTWLHSALSSPARHRGLSHVQQNYTDTKPFLLRHPYSGSYPRMWILCVRDIAIEDACCRQGLNTSMPSHYE